MTSVDARPPGVSFESTIIHDAVFCGSVSEARHGAVEPAHRLVQSLRGTQACRASTDDENVDLSAGQHVSEPKLQGRRGTVGDGGTSYKSAIGGDVLRVDCAGRKEELGVPSERREEGGRRNEDKSNCVDVVAVPGQPVSQKGGDDAVENRLVIASLAFSL